MCGNREARWLRYWARADSMFATVCLRLRLSVKACSMTLRSFSSLTNSRHGISAVVFSVGCEGAYAGPEGHVVGMGAAGRLYAGSSETHALITRQARRLK